MNEEFTGVKRKNLDSNARTLTKHWKGQILEPTPDTKWGLWLFGRRQSGTSYAALAVAADLAFHHDYLGAERVDAIDLLKELRGVWTAGQVMRTNSDDVGLYWEAVSAEDTLNGHFDADLLLIDDFHHETIDMPMWKKHVQPLVEQRVKSKKPTIVSTTMTPGDKSLPEGVVNGLFVTVLIDGYRPDARR
jgi:hypothetical protein